VVVDIAVCFLYSRERGNLLAIGDLSATPGALDEGRAKGGRRGGGSGLFVGESGREGDVLRCNTVVLSS
jgi:hypothetical protein